MEKSVAHSAEAFRREVEEANIQITQMIARHNQGGQQDRKLRDTAKLTEL